MDDHTPPGFEPLGRRSVLKKAGLAGGSIYGFAGVASASDHATPTEADLPIRDLAMEYEPHPNRPVIAFTSVTEEDGYQLYVGHGIKTASEVPDRVTQLTNAEYGVHGVSWKSAGILQYSRDGATYQRPARVDQRRGPTSRAERLIDDEPLPVLDTDVSGERTITTQAVKTVKCTNVPFIQDWCVRIHTSDGPKPTPRCNNLNAPGSMTHHHLLHVFRKGGDSNDGINIWAGTKNGCLWVGEENYSAKCWKLCKDGSGWPGFSTFVNHWEKILAAAVAAAGLSMSSAIINALAYILAGLSVKPPQPLPI